MTVTVMQRSSAASDPADTASAPATKDPRDVSTIAFPYLTLADAIAVAGVIHAKGAVAITRDQLAAAMGQQIGSGAFANKIGAARMFGLIETVSGKYQLTRLGFDIVSSDEARVSAAKMRSFLNVPLYRRAYDEFHNGQLPPRPLGLESAFVTFGVAPKQKERARRAFDNSARLAGFFEHGEDRLIQPVLGIMQENADMIRHAFGPAKKTAEMPPEQHADAVTMPPAAEHPFIEGLLLSLPKLGDPWVATDRAKWLQAAAAGFDLMYKGGGPISITADPKGDQNG